MDFAGSTRTPCLNSRRCPGKVPMLRRIYQRQRSCSQKLGGCGPEVVKAISALHGETVVEPEPVFEP